MSQTLETVCLFMFLSIPYKCSRKKERKTVFYKWHFQYTEGGRCEEMEEKDKRPNEKDDEKKQEENDDDDVDDDDDDDKDEEMIMKW